MRIFKVWHKSQYLQFGVFWMLLTAVFESALVFLLVLWPGRIVTDYDLLQCGLMGV